MIEVDIPMPDCCYNCPMSYWIHTGRYRGLLMCNALEYRDGAKDGKYLVDENERKRPEGCPIRRMIP